MAAELIQIIYDERQRASCLPIAKVYFNETLTIFFENEVIRELVSTSQANKIAVCSWKLKEKLKWYIGRPRPITQELLESEYDIMSFTKNSKHHQMLYAADKWHPGFKSTFSKILSAIGKNCPSEVKIPIYQNHFSAKTKIYQDYINTYLIPAMEVMKNDAEINKLVMVDSNYAQLDRTPAEKLKNLKEKIGIDYYPLAPFLLERLFSVYVHNNKLNVTWL